MNPSILETYTFLASHELPSVEPVLQPRSYLSKDEFLIDAARGRRVLHLGCVGFTDLSTDNRVKLAKQSLHWKLSHVAEVVGVDYSIDVVEEFARLGVFTNIVAGSVERLSDLTLPGPFDVIIAGDIIEHLSNPGAMLDGIRVFCSENTTLLITTPNAFGLPNYARFLLGGFKEGKEHVVSFNATTLSQLLNRHGYTVTRVETCFQRRSVESYGLRFKIGMRALTWAPRFGGTLLLVAKLSSH